jgi:hypothetical protein
MYASTAAGSSSVELIGNMKRTSWLSSINPTYNKVPSIGHPGRSLLIIGGYLPTIPALFLIYHSVSLHRYDIAMLLLCHLHVLDTVKGCNEGMSWSRERKDVSSFS